MTVLEQLFSPPDHDRRVDFWADGGYRSWSFAELQHEAERVSAGLRARGVGPGSVLAFVLTNSAETITAVMGAWLSGAAVASLPIPSRGLPLPEYARQIASMLAIVQSPLLVLEGRFAAAIAAIDPAIPVVDSASLATDGAPACDLPGLDDVAFVQFSSGSTATPRGCELTTAAIGHQIRLLSDALSLDPERDTGLSWLPFSHDMGFFGAGMFLLASQTRAVFGTPERFLTAPRSWVRDCQEFGATLTVAPPFALEVASRAFSESARPAAPLRSCILGGERVNWSTLQKAEQKLTPAGFAAQSMVPAYGLAEATLAITMNPPGSRPHALCLDYLSLLDGQLVEAAEDDPRATHVVSTGPPLDGVEARIDGGAVGEICVRSPSLARGYSGDEAATAKRFVDGELRTGDIGFIADGNLYVVGRGDDMLSVGGRNVFAQEFEARLGRITGVRTGNCALVDVFDEDRSRLVLVLESEGGKDSQQLERIAADVAGDVASLSGARLQSCVFVEHGQLPKTPSGKIQRFRCRALATVDDGDERVIARVDIDR